MIRLLRRRQRHHRPMKCREVGKLLQRYLDGHLDEERAVRLAAHLEDCRRCGLEAETYWRIKEALSSRRPSVPADALQRLREFSHDLVHGDGHGHAHDDGDDAGRW